MNKQILKYISFALIFIVIFSGGFILIFNNLYPKIEIYASIYENYSRREFSLGKLRVKHVSYAGDTSTVFKPLNRNDVFDLIEDSPYYVGEGAFNVYNSKTPYEGYYFIKDDNAYFLYEDKSGEFEITNLFCDYNFREDETTGKLDIFARFPCPGQIYLSYDHDFNSKFSEDQLNKVFNTISYQKAKEFYQGFDDGFAIFDDESQTIKVKVLGTDGFTENNPVIFDFVKKDIGYCLADGGETIWTRDHTL